MRYKESRAAALLDLFIQNRDEEKCKELHVHVEAPRLNCFQDNRAAEHESLHAMIRAGGNGGSGMIIQKISKPRLWRNERKSGLYSH